MLIGRIYLEYLPVWVPVILVNITGKTAIDMALEFKRIIISNPDMKDYDQAIECFLKAIECNPQDYDAYYNLGNVYDENNLLNLDRLYPKQREAQDTLTRDPKLCEKY